MLRVKFKEGNRLFYSQDFRYFRGVPAGVWFTCKEMPRWWDLKAPGYGQPGDYGSGSLFLFKQQKEYT